MICPLWDLVAGFVLEISSLTTVEYVCLVAHYNHVLSGSKSEIDPEIARRGYTPAQLAALSKAKRSNTDLASCGLRFKRHLSNFNFPLMPFLSIAFHNYERGVLPFPGSLSDQPAKIIEMFNVVGAIRSEFEDRIRTDLERKNQAANVRR